MGVKGHCLQRLFGLSGLLYHRLSPIPYKGVQKPATSRFFIAGMCERVLARLRALQGFLKSFLEKWSSELSILTTALASFWEGRYSGTKDG